MVRSISRLENTYSAKILKLVLLTIFLTAPMLSIAATTYYVDSSSGNDSNPGTQSSPWKTISKVNSSSFAPGDYVLFKRSGLWIGTQLEISSSGTSGHPITFGAYGTGNRPLIIGNANGALHAYSKNYITINGLHFQGGNYVCNVNGSHDVIATDLEIDSGTNRGWSSSGTTSTAYNITVSHCIVHDNVAEHGIYFGASSAPGPSRILVEYCTVYNNGNTDTQDHGIYFAYVTDGTMRNNISYSNHDCGFYVRDCVGPIIVSGNLAYSNGFHGINVGGTNAAGYGSKVIYNILFDNDDYGIDFSPNSDGFLIANNTVVNNGLGSIYLGGGSQSHNIENNIFYQDNTVCATRPIRVETTAEITSNTWDHNCVYFKDGNGYIAVVGGSNKTWAQWKALGADAHGINDEPNFVTNYTDFHIRSISPCRDAGQNIGLSKDFYGNSVPSGSSPDIGSHEYAGTTSTLTASASASPTSGQLPLAVSFTGSASGGTTPYSYRWTFGDGGSSTAQNPSHTYTSASTYTATLTVTDNASATASKSVTITVTSASSQVIATASGSPTAGPAPLSVGFTGGASGGTPPYSYSWNFGDGTSSISQNPGHVYTNLGDYVATLTVTDNTSASANATVNISVTSSTTAVLGLSAETGAPATGQGGTTNPTPGNHSYSIGTNVQVASIPNTDYRFSKWGGDVVEASMFSLTTTVALNGNKSLKATFCSKCGDVNGDLNITPSDAQMAFDIYLSKITDPTWCELENADVNSSGTKLVPKITPADSQEIFNKYLKKGTYSSDCSGASRAAATTQQKMLFNETTFTIDSGFLTSAGDIVIPVIVESAAGIGAFGFDLAFPSDNWIYVGLEASDLTSHFNQLAGNVVSYRASGPVKSGASVPNGLFLRVGGYKTSVDITPAVGVLVTLVFRSRTGFVDPSEVSIIAAYDDLKNALIYAGNIVGLRNTEGRAEVSRPADRRQERPVKGKLEF